MPLRERLAGSSIFYSRLKPFVEKNLEQFPSEKNQWIPRVIAKQAGVGAKQSQMAVSSNPIHMKAKP